MAPHTELQVRKPAPAWGIPPDTYQGRDPSPPQDPTGAEAGATNQYGVGFRHYSVGADAGGKVARPSVQETYALNHTLQVSCAPGSLSSASAASRPTLIRRPPHRPARRTTLPASSSSCGEGTTG